jgi:hypothetical protein
MLKWEEIDPSAKLTPAFSCTINHGIMDNAGNRMDLPARIYVDDALMLAFDVDNMKMVLAAMIKAIFVVVGELDVAARQCPLAIDKWLELVKDSSSTPTGSLL